MKVFSLFEVPGSLPSSVTSKNCKMSIKVAQKLFQQKNERFRQLLHKMPKNVGDLGKKLLPHALKSCPKCNESPNLVTLLASYINHSIILQIFTLRFPEFRRDIFFRKTFLVNFFDTRASCLTITRQLFANNGKAYCHDQADKEKYSV